MSKIKLKKPVVALVLIPFLKSISKLEMLEPDEKHVLKTMITTADSCNASIIALIKGLNPDTIELSKQMAVKSKTDLVAFAVEKSLYKTIDAITEKLKESR